MRVKRLLPVFLIWTDPAYAIPSPDLVINAFASIAQIVGLLAAMAGPALLRAGRDSGTHNARSSRWLSAFVAVAVLAILVNVWQFARHVSADSRRLETNLWRKPADWDRSFAAPTITSSELATRMDKNERLHLVDVREPEEFEVTHLPGAVNMRYADLLLGVRNPPQDGLPVVFVCDSGKRSGEVCEQRARRGLPCQVLEGGYPQWVRESRPMSTPRYGWRTLFTPLPRYSRDTTYLDTPEVAELVREDQARFVDVRSPDEFARGHLPEAINLPMRGMASDALSQALAQLPPQPLVAACYDNRSCFHARVLGLKLSRLGQDFRGRYTVPQEYPVPPQIVSRGAWPRVQRAWSTAIEKAVEPLALALNWVAERFGGLVPAMLALLLLTRLMLDPLAAKARRDSLVQRTISARTKDLRARYADDTFRLQRAIQQLRHQHGLTPWRNLAVSLLQLLVFLICFAAVRAVAQWSNASFLWLEQLREPDTTGALALANGVTAGALTWRLLIDTKMPRRLHRALGGLSGALMLWLGWNLASAVSLYLLASMVLLWWQQQTLRVRVERLRTWWLARKAQWYAVPVRGHALEDCKAPSQVGNKAWRQGQMLSNGLPVPAAWVWSAQDLDENEAHVLTELRALGVNPMARYAVRSSSVVEDSAAQSYAGVFRSELQVPWQAIPAAMQRVRASYAAADGTHTGGIIVQTMVDAQYAGVLFTRDPGNAGAMLIEWVTGLGDSLASGRVTPSALRLGRVSGLPLDGDTYCPVIMAPLVTLAQAIERQFGRPQDIEWAFAQGRFYILQARDLVSPSLPGDTPLDLHALIEHERTRLLNLLALTACSPDEAALQKTDLSAELPRPTPMSLSLMQHLRGDGGSTDRACERLGLRWQMGPHNTPDVQSAFGQTFVLQTHTQVPPLGMVASFYLSRSASSIEAHFRHTFLPNHMEAMRWREVMDLRDLSTSELVATFQTWTRQFVQTHYVEADVINIAAEFYARASAKALASKNLNPQLLASPLDSDAAAPTLTTHGHRALHDWELSEPRFHEDPEAFSKRFGVNSALPALPADQKPSQAPRLSLLDSSVQRAQAFARLKEDAKHLLLREWAQLRRLLLVLDQRLAFDGLLFYLELTELPGVLSAQATTLRQRAAVRRAHAQAFDQVVLGSSLSVRELETRTDWLHAPGPKRGAANTTGSLKGVRVSGRHTVTGRARILREPGELTHLRFGEIAVVALADPIWLGGFDRAAGLVSEVGGWLAHLAILAREQDLPAVFGVAHALQELQTGDVITLELDGSVRRVLQGS